MSNDERLILNNYLEALYQAMQIGDIVFEANHSSELYNLINKLLKENQELKRQLSNSHQMKNQQKEFIEWLENESKEVIRDAGYHQRICLEILSKYKEIIGVKNE